MKKFYDCGIDLGTTNSCIAVPTMDNTCTIVENITDRMQVTPSAVWINQRGRMVIGQRAYTCPNTQDVKREFKRDMGTETVYDFPSAGIQKTPEELSSEVLKSLRQDAQNRMGREMRDVVVTVPAAFSMVQCEATKKAATMAGFRNIILLQEPIAASIAYGAQPDAKDQYWLVFDYGGGTLDVSVISTKDGRLDNITSVGNNHKGGKDLDRLFYEKVILPKLSADYEVSGGLNPASRARLMHFVESCKIELTNEEVTDFEVFDVTDNAGKMMDGYYEITRAEFEAAIREEVAEAVDFVREAIRKSGIPESEFTKVILVGGTTYVPLVRQMIRESFDIELDTSLNPMTVVAEGAAYYAASISTEDIQVEPEDVAEGSLLLNLEYDPMTADETVNVIGRIDEAQGRVARVKVDQILSEDSQSAIWTSGWVEVLDPETGIFDVDVQISHLNARNLFRVSAAMEDGTEVPLAGNTFEILHQSSALKLSAPPMPYAVGIMVTDGKDNRIDWLVAKDTKLPVSMTASYVLTKPLDPRKKDSVQIKIYEGDGERFTYNPDANHLMRTVHIQSRELTRKLEVGTKVDITIEIDESRCVKVTGWVPVYDYELLAETLGSSEENYVNYGERMQEVKLKLAETSMTLRHLREKEGFSTEEYDDALESVKADFDKYEGLVGEANDQVHQYMEDFYSLQTEIIMKERELREDLKADQEEQIVNEAEEVVEKYGTPKDQQKLADLLRQMEKAKNQTVRSYVAEEIRKFVFQILIGNMDFLKTYYYTYFADTNEFMDLSSALRWKAIAVAAIVSEDKERLQNAIMNLQKLHPRTAGEAARLNLADLRG